MKPVPDKLVVLTFDDGCKSDIENVAPLLRKRGFGATFFVNDSADTPEDWNPEHYLTWPQARQLQEMGFEIGNHTARHPNVANLSLEEFLSELESIERRCAEYGIGVPSTFCYPGYAFGAMAVRVLSEKGYTFARRGVEPEFEIDGEGCNGPAYDPAIHHRLLVPTTGAAGPHWGFDDLVRSVKLAVDGKICVLNFHGVPDLEHPWVHTDPAEFERYVDYLAKAGCTVVGLRDLADHVDLSRPVNDPLISS